MQDQQIQGNLISSSSSKHQYSLSGVMDRGHHVEIGVSAACDAASLILPQAIIGATKLIPTALNRPKYAMCLL
jgi:hypothetical protein